jgi:urease gamma subunit
MSDIEKGKLCLTEACRAAKRRDSFGLDLKLKELSRLKLNEPDIMSFIPPWIQQVVKDEGLRLFENVFITKGPGYGLEIKIKW